METITISRERYDELIVAESEAKLLKELLKDRVSNYTPLRHEEIRAIVSLFGIEWKNEEV